jgi:putative flippase GtrA
MYSAIYLPLGRFARPVRFGLVGLSGVVVNTSVLWALARGAHLPVPLASALATETAILSNFALNDRWTFRAARQHPLLMRLLRFNGVSLGGLTITILLLTLLTSYGGLHLLLANLLAIGAAMAWNYAVNSRWTWSDRPQASSDELQAPGFRLQAVNRSGHTVVQPLAVDMLPAACGRQPGVGDIEEEAA